MDNTNIKSECNKAQLANIKSECNKPQLTNENLEQIMHNIQNYMKTNGFGRGKTALETFKFFYGLKLIKNKLNKFKLSNKQKQLLNYKLLLQFAEKRKMESYDSSKTTKITDYLELILKQLEDLSCDIEEHKLIWKYIYHDIPNRKKSIKEDKWYFLIQMINNIPVNHVKGRVNLSGKLHEYFMGEVKQI